MNVYAKKLEKVNKHLNKKRGDLEDKLTEPYYRLAKNFDLKPIHCEILNDNSDYKIVQSVRQGGKTTLAKVEAITKALKSPIKVLIFTFSEKNAFVTFEEIIDILKNVLFESITTVNSKNLEIVLNNGSEIYVRATFNTHLTTNFDLLVMDELACMANNDVTQWWSSNEKRFKQIFLLSTAVNGNDTLFFQIWRYALKATNPEFKPFTISMEDCFTAKKIQEIQKRFNNLDIMREFTIRN